MPAKTHTMHGRDHLPRGADPIPNLPDVGGQNLADRIIASPDLAAFWKLNESSGTTAVDSSGQGWHLYVPAGYSAPTWGQAAGPPGDQTAGFVSGVDDALARNASGDEFPTLPDAFTAAIWVNLSHHAAAWHYLLGQGLPEASGGEGWALMVGGGAPTGGVLKLFLSVNDNSGAAAYIVGNNALTDDGTTWYQLAVTRSAAGLFTLFVNGLAQANTGSLPYLEFVGMNLGELSLGGSGSESTAWNLKGLASYAAIWTRALTSTELLGDYTTGITGGALEPGQVWTTDGAGGAEWAYPTITVNF